MRDVAHRALARGYYCGVRERRDAVVERADEWRALWERVLGPGERPPDVDFATERVLACFMGERSTGGHAISVTRAREEDGVVVVDVLLRSPSSDAMVTMALTAPYEIVAIPRGPPVRVRESHERGG